MARTEKLKKKVDELWRTAVAQAEEVRDTLQKRGEEARADLSKQLTTELSKLRVERDRLLVRLGEQTLEWVNKSPVRMPSVVQKTVDNLNQVIDSLKETPRAPTSAAKASAAKASAKKKSTKATSTTATAKPAAKAKAPKAKPAAKKRPPNKAPVSKKAQPE